MLKVYVYMRANSAKVTPFAGWEVCVYIETEDSNPIFYQLGM